MNNIAVILHRANALVKIKNFVKMNTLRNIYFAKFNSHPNYSCIVWAQNINAVNRLIILQKKALRIMNFNNQSVMSLKPTFLQKQYFKI